MSLVSDSAHKGDELERKEDVELEESTRLEEGDFSSSDDDGEDVERRIGVLNTYLMQICVKICAYFSHWCNDDDCPLLFGGVFRHQ